MAIMALLGDVANIVKGNRPGTSIDIDNKVFQLHYRFTTFIFFLFSLLSTANSLLGEPINCACLDCERAGLSSTMIDTHCWVTGTYTVAGSLPRQTGLRREFYGIGTLMHTSARGDNSSRKYHMYYQWVPFVLFMQGVLFYIPHWMWEINEDGRVQALVKDLRGPGTDKEVVRKKTQQLTAYVLETMGTYDGYYLRFVMCDLLNIINTIANLFVTNIFLNRDFVSYGSQYLHFLSQNDSSLINPMLKVFPKLTKCHIQIFGVSGTLQDLDAICVLALNILNEKVYLVLWFWLFFLAIVSTTVFILRGLFMLVKRSRIPMFQRRAHTMRVEDIETIAHTIKIGDYFFIGLLAKNLDITAFRMFLSQLAKSLQRRRQFRKLVHASFSTAKRMRQERKRTPRLSINGQNNVTLLTPDTTLA